MAVTISEADWARHKAQLLQVRYAVFVDEQGVPPELEHDALDADAIHLLARDAQDGAVATARMLLDGHIGRMAVSRAFRGQGIGTAMLQRLIRIAAERGLRRLFLHAQCDAVPFYQRLGFVAEGEIFKDAGIDHQVMCMTTPSIAN